jgi:hypothetical protein
MLYTTQTSCPRAARRPARPTALGRQPPCHSPAAQICSHNLPAQRQIILLAALSHWAASTTAAPRAQGHAPTLRRTSFEIQQGHLRILACIPCVSAIYHLFGSCCCALLAFPPNTRCPHGRPLQAGQAPPTLHQPSRFHPTNCTVARSPGFPRQLGHCVRFLHLFSIK